MAQQRTFASLAWTTQRKVTRRERFLTEMDAVIPWAPLLGLIEPYSPKAGRGRRPVGLELMLRLYFVPQWFNLSDLAAEDARYDSEAIRRFVGVELADDRLPDETTILCFGHLLERQALTAALFAAIREVLEEKRLLVKGGTIVAATIIAAPSSTKNATGTRDPGMWQTRKGNQWYFGMKAHIGTDTRGVVQRERNRQRSRTRARGEHPFLVVKRLWDFSKVRYRGIRKNLARVDTMFGLANRYRLRHRLLPRGWQPRLA